MTHTPGPWSYDEQASAICSMSSWLVEPTEGDPGIRTGIIDTYAAMGGEDTSADARLMAAAPELLEALEEALIILAWDVPDPEDVAEDPTLRDIAQKRLEKALNAINKARGNK